MRSGKEAPAGVAAVEGEILDPASLAGALQDVSVIIHLAAVFRTRDEELIWKVNLEGTRSLGFRPTVRTVYQAAQEKLL